MMNLSQGSKAISARLDHDDYIATRHFANLDGLRFLCIAMVLWHHTPLWEGSAVRLLSRGFLGVDFFFVLSGFLITTLLLRERRAFGDFSLKDFYLRRLLRIVPVYYFVVLVVSGYFILVGGRQDYTGLVPFYLLFLSNFLTEHIPMLSITWSLSVEEQYYLLWPLLLGLLPPRWTAPVLAAMIGASLGIALGLLPTHTFAMGPLQITLPSATYTAILMGSLAAWLLDRRESFAPLAALLGHRATATGLLALLVAVLQIAPPNLHGLPTFVVHVLMTLTLISLLVAPRNLLSPLLEAAPIARIGVVSYGIYLYHHISRHITLHVIGLDWGTQPVLTFAVYALLAWALAELSFRTLEAAFRRFRPKPRRVKAARAAD